MNNLKHYYELEVRVTNGPEFKDLKDRDLVKISDSIGFKLFELNRATLRFKSFLADFIDEQKIQMP